MITPQAHLGDCVEFFSTYKKLKKNLVSLIKKNNGAAVFVVRSRRGEWGEWFEYWSLGYNEKPVLGKHGWS